MELTRISENKVCNCSKEDYYRFGSCFKKKFLGETCTNLGECYESWNRNRVVCRNGKCACIWDYMISNGVCVEHPQSSQLFLNGGATNIVSRGHFFNHIFYTL
ncbi:uncharacterized protein [Mycetomoellerius zeteki]|uniref:uncharacterized protein n=1 Tax=Mycetomoellerius zeteki TaxID=64791 RepID=UPI00084E5D7B|nr:PREDICTED: uncharacterized protein LOC108729045 [Trachymyrmex zeteki]